MSFFPYSPACNCTDDSTQTGTVKIFTSDDSQLGLNADLAFTILCHTLVDVLVSWSPQRLDTKNSSSTFIKFYGL